MYDNENNDGYYNSSDGNNTDNNSNETNNSYYNSSDDNSSNGYYNSSDNNSSNGYYNNSNNNGYYNSSYNNGSNDSGNGPKKKNKNKGIAIAVAISAIIVIVSLAVVVAVAYRDINPSGIDEIMNNIEEQTQESKYEDIGSTNITENSASTTTGGVMVTDVSGVVEEAMPSVVAITSKTLVESNSYPQDIFEFYFYGGGGTESYEQEAAGSGIIVDQTDTELLIVTNNHVVEGSDSLKIQFNGEDTDSAVDGYIKGTDPNADIAVVAVKLKDISSGTMKNIKKATIGDSDSVKVGEGVIAIGNALGYGQSVTTGVISAKDREAVIEDKTMKLLQTDAAINGGNSGGALLNSKGEVIGINVAKYSSSDYTSASIEGMGFAIPISSVKDIINTLETKETRTKVSEEEKGYLGIIGYDVDEEKSQQYGLPIGICVQTVNEGSPAYEAGIQQYDVITKFDGQVVTSMAALQDILDYYKAGEKVTITISRNSGKGYAEKEVTVKLGSKSVIEDLQNY